MACLRFLGTQLRSFLLAPDRSIFNATLPSIFKSLQRMMHYDASIDVRCMIPELYYHMCVISMEFPVSGITVPLILNEFFSLFQRTETEIRSYASRYCGMLFSELVGTVSPVHLQILRSVDRKYFKKNQYMESHASETASAEKEEKKDGYVYNPNEYSFESILKILMTKMSTSMPRCHRLTCSHGGVRTSLLLADYSLHPLLLA